MANASADLIKRHTAEARQRLLRAGERLLSRQSAAGAAKGNVPPWHGSQDLDFHGTLAAIWVWSRAQKLAGDDRFAAAITLAWKFVRTAWPRFIPHTLGSRASDEAAYDCAMVLRAALADPLVVVRQRLETLVEGAARLLAAYLSDLQDLSGRGFLDPGVLAWNLAQYARAANNRGLLAVACRFVDRAFGMKRPPAFTSEPQITDDLFDFSCTTATRVLAVIAAEGKTPLVGAWLRERVAGGAPDGFVERNVDENAWNACAAAALGRAYMVATDPGLYDKYRDLMAELISRDERGSGGLGKGADGADETLATFYYGLALDALAKG